MLQNCVSHYSLTTFLLYMLLPAYILILINQLSFLTAEHKFLLQLTL
jgi:hypothetical protein